MNAFGASVPMWASVIIAVLIDSDKHPWQHLYWCSAVLVFFVIDVVFWLMDRKLRRLREELAK